MTEHQAHRSPRLAGVILAGGEGRRLGGAIKANIEVGGTRLVDRVAGTLRPHCTPLLLSTGRTDPSAFSPAPDLIAVPDPGDSLRGPLAGLVAAVAWLEQEPSITHLVSVAVDTPFLPADFVDRLREAAYGGAAAAVAGHGDDTYPTNAIWRLDVLSGLPRQTELGRAPTSIGRLAVALEARTVLWSPEAGGNPFANINTPEDLATLRQRAFEG